MWEMSIFLHEKKTPAILWRICIITTNGPEKKMGRYNTCD